MIQDNPEIDKFKQQLRDSLQNETLNSRSVKVPRHENVYNSGDGDGMIYFIETGQVKLLMLSSEGKECILGIHTTGDILRRAVPLRLRRTLRDSHCDEGNELKANTFHPILRPFGPGLAMARIRALSRSAHRRPAADHRQSGNGR